MSDLMTSAVAMSGPGCGAGSPVALALDMFSSDSLGGSISAVMLSVDLCDSRGAGALLVEEPATDSGSAVMITGGREG